MKAFSLDATNNITVHASRKAAVDTGHSAFGTEEQLLELVADDPGRLVGIAIAIWSTGIRAGLSGKALINYTDKKFATATVAAQRIVAALQKLEPGAVVSEAKPVGGAETPQAAHVASGKGRAKKEATPVKKSPTARKVRRKLPPEVAVSSLPRESSKTARVIGMLQRDGGATIEQIMSKMGWLPHTTRALLSKGGAIYKKHGLPVTSEVVDGKRRYKIG